jgi:hypothetical protein
MENLESKRKLLNKLQTELRKSLTANKDHESAIKLFLEQHTRLHGGKMIESNNDLIKFWSYEDLILNDMTYENMRIIPKNDEHSIAWCLWHLARIEDTAMNILVAGTQQILDQFGWIERLNIPFRDTGNKMDERDITCLCERIDILALRDYRAAVGRKTQEIVKSLSPQQLKEKVNPERIQQVMVQGALVDAAQGIADYWSKRNIAGLLLMPATRHNLVHLNEAYRIKKKII